MGKIYFISTLFLVSVCFLPNEFEKANESTKTINFQTTESYIEGWNKKVNTLKAKNGSYHFKYSYETFYLGTITTEGPLLLT